MPADPWTYIIKDVPPIDGGTYWIRQLWVEVPVQAVWHDATKTFTCPNGLDLAWYFVTKWRP